jgi:hypothetical protein
MRGAAIFDSVSAGVPEAVEAIDLAEARIGELSEGDFHALLTELTARDPLSAADTEVLALCLTESARRILRNTPAD